MNLIKTIKDFYDKTISAKSYSLMASQVPGIFEFLGDSLLNGRIPEGIWDNEVQYEAFRRIYEGRFGKKLPDYCDLLSRR